MSNPHVQDSAFWEAAIEHYHWDRLEAAYAAIQQRGVGEAGTYIRWYRLIEAEALSRRRSKRTKVNSWLTFECIPEDALRDESDLIAAAVEACDSIAERLGWSHSAPTLISVLAEEVDAPWATNPYGYYVSKELYEKICLPAYLVEDREELSEAVAHEYAHVISETASDGMSPAWLSEAVSVIAEGSPDPEALRILADGAWLKPEDLELTLDGRYDESNQREVWLAYQQCGTVGRYLSSLKGEPKLLDLMREHTNESVWRNLWLSLRGKSRVDGAVEAIYGMSVRELHERAHEWLRVQEAPKP